MLMNIFNMLSSPLLSHIIVRALTVGVLVSLCASVLGVTMVLRRMSMIGDGLSHAGFGALAVATVLNVGGEYRMEISIPIVMLSAFILMRLSDRGKMGGDAAIAVMSTGMMTAGVIIFSMTTGYTSDMCSSLFGSASILTLTDKNLYLSIVLSVAVIILFLLFYTRIFSVTFDEQFSAATGVRADLYKIIISILISVTVVIGMNMIGAIMISALIVFPALTAMRICKSFRGVIITAAVYSVVCFMIGFVISCELAIPAGAAVVAVDLLAFTVTCAIKAICKRRAIYAVKREAYNATDTSGDSGKV